MMKFHAAITAGLAATIVIPAVTLDTEEIGTLEDALSNTVRALELVTGIQKKFETEKKSDTGLVLAMTEDSILDPQLRDERLHALRNEVNLLQTELDLIESDDLGITPVATTPPPPTGVPEGEIIPAAGAAGSIPRVTTGLDDATRRALADLQRKDRGEDVAEAPEPAETVAPFVSSTEKEGYSADPLRHARACYRIERYAEGAAILKDLKSDPRALYWRARCLEKLGQLDEAARALRKVIELSPDTPEGRNAKSDLEFIEWKRGFLDKLGENGGRTQKR